jgi:hypothetical protein
MSDFSYFPDDPIAQNVGGVLVYRALLTQTGTNAPVATVVENSLVGIPVWTYRGVGAYRLTLNGMFPVGSVHTIIGSNLSIITSFSLSLTDHTVTNFINFNTYDVNLTAGTITAADGVWSNTSVQILVYPMY